VVVDGGFGALLLMCMTVAGYCLISHSPNYNISETLFMTTQLVILHRPFRSSLRTVVMKPNGQVVVPVRRIHGLATWLLEPGRYIAVTIRRLRGLYEVTVQCLELSQGERRVTAEASLYTRSISKSDLAEWARACAN